MACYYMKKECTMFLEYIVPNDMCKHGFTHHFFAYSSKRWIHLYSTRKNNMIVSMWEIATYENKKWIREGIICII